MVCILKSDNFEFQSDDVNSNKKLSLWKRKSPHEFELALLANSQSARFRVVYSCDWTGCDTQAPL